MLSIQWNSFIDNLVKNLGQSAKNIAVNKAWGILQLAVVDTIQAIESNYPNLKGADKKTIAMELISGFYDRVFLVIDIPYVPKVFQPIIQKYVKILLMSMVGSAIDAMVTTFRKTGIFVDPKTTLDPNVDHQLEVSDK